MPRTLGRPRRRTLVRLRLAYDLVHTSNLGMTADNLDRTVASLPE
jgi:hypothetical protein